MLRTFLLLKLLRLACMCITAELLKDIIVLKLAVRFTVYRIRWFFICRCKPVNLQLLQLQVYPFCALTLLVGQQEGHPACKNWVVGCWRGYLSGERCRLAHGPAAATATQPSLASVKSRLVFSFLVPASPGKGLLNGYVYTCVCV